MLLKCTTIKSVIVLSNKLLNLYLQLSAHHGHVAHRYVRRLAHCHRNDRPPFKRCWAGSVHVIPFLLLEVWIDGWGRQGAFLPDDEGLSLGQ